MNKVYNVIKDWCDKHSNELKLNKKLLIGGKMWYDLLNTLTKNGFGDYVNNTEFTGDEMLGILDDFNVEVGYSDEEE